MNRRTLLACGVALSALLPVGTALAETTLRLATQMLPGHHSVQLLESFAEDLATATDGSLKVQIHTSGQLYKGPDLPMAVGSGSIEMADMVTPYLAPIYPELELLDGPFMVDSTELAKRLFSDLTDELNPRFERLGMKIVAVHPYGFFSMYGSKGHKIAKPEDMKSLTIRAVEKTQILKAQAVGAKPVAIPGSEQFIAYQKGTVDLGQTGPTSFVSRKLYEVFDSGTILRDDLMVFFLTIGTEVWDRLSEEEQRAVMQAGQDMSAESWDLMEQEEREADKFLAENMDLIVIEGEASAPWRAAFEPVNEKLAEEAGAAGEELYQKIKAVRSELGLD